MGVSAILQPGTRTFCGVQSIEDPALLVKRGGRKQLKLPLLQYRHALVVKASGELNSLGFTQWFVRSLLLKICQCRSSVGKSEL